MIFAAKKVHQYASAVANRASNFVNGNCSILLYHRVSAKDGDISQLSVCPDYFYEHLTYLKRKCNVLEINEFTDILETKKKFPDRSVLITFDDGYKDNHYVARPILETLGLQALFFIATGYVDSQKEFWWDKLERIIMNHTTFNAPFYVPLLDLPFSKNENRITLYEKLIAILKRSAPIERDSVIQFLEMYYTISGERKEFCAMSWDELREFQSSKAVVLGAHTVTHSSMKYLDSQSQILEIQNSVNALIKNLNISTVHFSFPYGTPEYFTSQSIDICLGNGLKYVYGDYYPVFSSRNVEQLLPRVVVKNYPSTVFQKKIKSYPWYF